MRGFYGMTSMTMPLFSSYFRRYDNDDMVAMTMF